VPELPEVETVREGVQTHAASQGAADTGELGAVASCDATGDVGVIGTHRDHD